MIIVVCLGVLACAYDIDAPAGTAEASPGNRAHTGIPIDPTPMGVIKLNSSYG